MASNLEIIQNVEVVLILKTDILRSYVSLFHNFQGGELTVEVVGSSGVAAAWALHHYLQQHAGVQVRPVCYFPEPGPYLTMLGLYQQGKTRQNILR